MKHFSRGFKSSVIIFLHCHFLLSNANTCFCSHTERVADELQKCIGDLLMLTNINDERCGIVILDLKGAHIIFIFDDPLSASPLLIGLI